MSTVAESAQYGQLLAGTLDAGIGTISNQQQITFNKYSNFVSPIDGLSYWVLVPNTSISVLGSLHFWTEQRQEQDATYGRNRVTFTAESPINDFNAISPTTIYAASMGEFYYAFSSNKNFYAQSDLYHYQGDGIYPHMLTQLVTSQSLINNTVVSNSLSIWLSLASGASVSMYPSFLAPSNITTPFITVHIGDSDTTPMQPVPFYEPQFQLNGSGQPVVPLVIQGQTHNQLCRDRVTLTFWGFTNQAVITFFDYLMTYMTNNDTLGLLGEPVIKDAKRTQPELRIIGQKKSMLIDVSYYQAYAYNQAVQLILSALPSVGVQ